ncbi:Yip1 family protein [Paenibacillus spongiae]|uniref:YIP1 family protein n=1 Tax=Paenibacillus spongiae TaxID=2909671 RepID=A0ABY5S9K3_9BACL|nr:Yip1 family protein [Paenibacillus spongiae]UVI30230.1 YIP1 family protein [Paenibacillus spongiae]
MQHFKFPLRLITHPFEGFWDMKYEGKGRLSVSFAIVFLLTVVMILQKQFAGFLVNMNDPRYLNSIDELKFIVIPFVLWCVSNWSVTTLMEGEGRFKDIVMATAYSLVPMVLIYLPTTIVSNFMAQEETAFYYLLNSFALLWFVYLLFIGMMTVHQYTASRTVVTMLLTLIVMAIVVFLGMLMFSMIQQIIDFIVNLYTELVFRA